MHRTILRAFPGPLDTDRVLFRLDYSREGGQLTLLVQSRLTPDWSHHQSLTGYLLGSPESKEFSLAVRSGQRLRFRLRANPTVKREGKRLGLLTEESQRQWLDRKATEGGFRVLGVQVVREGMAQGRKTEGEQRHGLSHLAVRYDGVLEVAEPDRLLCTVASGIGSGKAFGFGLLSVAPAGGDA
jgi:CRISPR system Cascade subunit CasE